MKQLIVIFLAMIFASCSSNKNKQEKVIVRSTNIVVDESFAPIIEDQYIVFESSYPQYPVNLSYKPEIHLLNTLLQDSVDIAIMARKLSATESNYFEKKNILVKNSRIATDAIALITHRSSPDSVITVEQIKSIIRGESGTKSLVFDNPNSSTVRYIRELAGVTELPKKGVYALNSNSDVIKYVHNNPGTIGVIGINWMKQPPLELEKIVAGLKVMAVKNAKDLPGSDDFYKPSQNNLALGLYALSRELFIVDCKGGTVGTAFAAFILGERGQRIILKSGLLPDSIPSREIIIRKSITP